MRISLSLAGVARALRATGSGLAVSFVHTALITAAGLVLNWGFIALAAGPLARDSSEAEAALAALPVPMSIGFVALILGLLVPAIYFLLGQQQGAAAATRHIYRAYREDVVAALVAAWRRARPHVPLPEAGTNPSGPDRRMLRRALEGWEETPAPVRAGLTRLIRLPVVRTALDTAMAEARARGGEADDTVVVAALERQLTEAILRPAYTWLWLLLAGNVVLLIGVAALLGLL